MRPLTWLSLLWISLLFALPAHAQPALPPGCQELLINGGFEDGGQSWQLNLTPWPAVVVSDESRSGANALFAGLAEEAANQQSNSLAQQRFILPVNARQITLSFWARVPAAGAPNDFHYALLLSPGGEIASAPLFSRQSNADWQQIEVDVTADLLRLAGQELRLQVGVSNDGIDPRIAWLVDDISLVACPEAPPAGETLQATASLAEEATAAPEPTATPTEEPAAVEPTASPVEEPTATPAEEPTATPSPVLEPTPTLQPTMAVPSPAATIRPTATPRPRSTPTPTLLFSNVPLPDPTSSLLNNQGTPLLLAVLLSGVVILIAMAVNFRR